MRLERRIKALEATAQRAMPKCYRQVVLSGTREQVASRAARAEAEKAEGESLILLEIVPYDGETMNAFQQKGSVLHVN